jgi:hypothetical protein
MMNGLSREAQEILSSARHLDDPTDVQRARVKRALFASVAAGVTATAVTTGAAVAAAPAPIAKIVLSAVLVLSGVGGGVWVGVRSARHTAKPVHAAASVHKVASAPTVVPMPPPEERPAPPTETPVAVALPRRHVAPAHPAGAPGRLQDEIALLAEANAALRASDAPRALALLRDYDARFPHGMLREEVEASRIISHCQLTPGPAAAAAAAAFLDRHPASPLAPRVRSSCLQGH